MKQYKNKHTGEEIIGTFKESTKTHKKAGWDWSLVREDGSRQVFVSIQEFVDKYDEEPNELYTKVMRDINKFFLSK